MAVGIRQVCAADSPRRSHSVPASLAMIWMGTASPPSCGNGGVRGRQRRAISPSAWDGPSRRAAHGLSGLSVRSEQYICGCVRCDAESRRTAAARSGIFGWTIRDSSCYHWMAVGIRQVCAADSPRRSHSVRASHAMIWMGAASPPSCGVGGVRGRQRSAIFAVRTGRPYAASGAWVVRTWRAIRAIYMWVRPLRC